MANDLLINAIRVAGLVPDEIADIAGVDPRTAQRWLAGRVPHPRYRQKLAAALGAQEQELWPSAGLARREGDLSEIVAAFAQRNHPDAPDWRALLTRAEQQIDLLGHSLLHVAEGRNVNKQLSAKARDGCQVRIALADPTSDHVLVADQQQRPPGRLVSRIKNARDRLSPLTVQAGVELRTHHVATSHTILRFDDQLLLTVHLHATPGFQAPLLHIRRNRDYGLFDQLAKHFEDVWQTARPIGAPGVDASPPLDQTTGNSESILDRLDYVWRPSR